MDKKYTIFVSSTQSDLRDERDAVAKAILELGHIPVGMEMFSAADEQQWQLIQRQIDQCDYYIVIIAHRYGSMAGTVSYTEREYDYAVSREVPVLGFIIEESATWPVDRVEKEATKHERLNAFKEKVKKKMISFWSNADQLNGKVLAALSKQFALTPRPGWVRASDVPGHEVLSELARLSSENSELRNRVESDTRLADAQEILQGFTARIAHIDIKDHPTVTAAKLPTTAGAWLKVELHNSAPHMLTPFTFQVGVVMAAPMIDLLLGRDVRHIGELGVKKTFSGDSEITYLSETRYSILPGAWESFWVGLLDHKRELASPVNLTIRIFSPVGTRDFEVQCVIPPE